MAGTSGVETSGRGERERYPVFDSLRIIAAVAVILAHAFPLSGHREPFEIDLGDCRVWRGVHYSRQIECFLDDESGAVVPVLMWRYLGAAQ